jgi:DNA-binding Xre family transcriptional regulator
MSPIALRLKELRQERGLSQAALAKRAGIRQATISELETGKSQAITFDVLERLARALQVAPGEILDVAPRRRRPK